MVRKTSKKVSTYTNLSTEDVSAIVTASAGKIKEKQVDPRKLVGTIHIKKYLADVKINGKVETWISVIKKLTAPLEEGAVREELTAEEVEALEECKKQTATYLEEDASTALKLKVSKSEDEYQNLKDVSSSMKFKFSRFAYEAVTHVINLMTRELLTFTCDSCASQKAKLTKVAHVPWRDLQSKMLSGLYMNTKAVFEVIHPAPVVEEVAEETPATEGASDEAEPTTDAESSDTEPTDATEPVAEGVKSAKPRLSQYISNTFKEIVSRDERFKGLLLGKEVTALVNDIIYQVLDRYSNVIKSLLQTANSKTVNERLALIATKILLQDHTHANEDDLAVIFDIVQTRLEDLKETPEDDATEDSAEATPEASAEKPEKPKKTKGSKKN